MAYFCYPGFETNPVNPSSCVPECPTQQGFTLQVKNGVPACVYKDNPDVFFSLKTINGVSSATLARYPSIQSLTAIFPSWKRRYEAAISDYNKESALALEKVSKETQLADAFRALQAAENVRDTSPEAYQEARIRYYTLKNGESWVAEEEARIRNGEAKEKTDDFLSDYADLSRREQQQAKTMDVVNAVKDNLISMKDDFELTTGAFAKQLTDLKNQIQMEKTKGAIQTASVLSWVGTLLNVLLVGVLVVAVIVLVRKQFARPAYTSSPTPS